MIRQIKDRCEQKFSLVFDTGKCQNIIGFKDNKELKTYFSYVDTC